MSFQASSYFVVGSSLPVKDPSLEKAQGLPSLTRCRPLQDSFSELSVWYPLLLSWSSNSK
jgi:hypothetical protein